MFLASLDDTIKQYKELLAAADQNRLQLPNENFDTGRPTKIGDYHLADETYDKLLARYDGHVNEVSAAVRENVLMFYGAAGSPESEKSKAVLASLRTETAAVN